MSVLVDTNVLLRRTQPANDKHASAVESVAQLLASGEAVCITPQVVAEFWNVITHPILNNGLGFAAAAAHAEVDKPERVLSLLPDVPALYGEWKRLVVQYGVLGVKVHDARLVAAMNIHGVPRILTFNAGDFARYGIEVLEPSMVLGR
jgi:predicted nucleic acid-binding protein